MRLRSLLFCVLTLAASALPAAVLTWPGPAPCNSTLQACVTGAASGDIVEIATAAPVVEFVAIDKSLTVRPASGFAPEIDGGFFVQGIASATDVTIEDLVFVGGLGATAGAGNLSVHFLRNSVSMTSSFATAIEILSGTSPPYGNVSAEVLDNVVQVTGAGPASQCHGIGFGPVFDAGASRVAIDRNSLTVTGCDQGSAISLANGPGDTLVMEVVGNRVAAPGTDSGIAVRADFSDPGSQIVGRLLDNLVTGQTDVSGSPAAISLFGFDAAMTVEVANNTLVGNQSGIAVQGAPARATISAHVINNLVAFNSVFGLNFGAGFSVSNDHNLVFGNGSDLFTPGAGTITADPRLVSIADPHLGPSSPAINGGDNGAVPGDHMVDIDGAPRIAFGTVDIGAFEAQQVSVAAIPTLSPDGVAGLGIGLALAAVAVLRRRARGPGVNPRQDRL